MINLVAEPPFHAVIRYRQNRNEPPGRINQAHSNCRISEGDLKVSSAVVDLSDAGQCPARHDDTEFVMSGSSTKPTDSMGHFDIKSGGRKSNGTATGYMVN